MKTYRYKVLLETYWRHQRFDPEKSGDQGVVEIQVDEDNPAPRTFLPLNGGPIDDNELSANTLAVIERKTKQYMSRNNIQPYEARTYAELQDESKAAIPVGSDKAFESSNKFKKQKVVRKSASSSSDDAGLGD